MTQIIILKYKEKVIAQITYIEGYLESISDLLAASKMAKKPNFSQIIPNNWNSIEEAILVWTQLEIVFEILTVENTGTKIATFCACYANAFGEAYKAAPKDTGLWNTKYKYVTGSPELIAFYMSCEKYPINGPKGILDYLTYFQQVKQLLEKDKKEKANPDKFPYTWDKELYNELSIKDVAKFERYKAWLRSIGYKATKNTANQTVWRKEVTT